MTADAPQVETARYKVFLNKSDKHVIVFRIPDRDRSSPLNEARDLKPLQIRLKPKNGLVEVDIPLPDRSHVDRRRAIELGLAMNKHSSATNAAPVGLAGGFGARGPMRAPRTFTDDQHPELLLRDFDESMRLGKALSTLTLSGQIKPFSSTDPSYYLGNFQDNELHLTKVAAFCTLSAGLQHLDALDANDKATRRAAQEEDMPEEKAAIVGMQVKSVDDRQTEESVWKKMLTDVAEEPWQRLEWIDENDQQSFEVFQDKLFLKNEAKSHSISAVMSERQYLDFISAPKVDPFRQGQQVKGNGSLAEGGYYDESTDASDQEEEDQQMTHAG